MGVAGIEEQQQDGQNLIMAAAQIRHDLQGIHGDQMARRGHRAADDIFKGAQSIVAT